MTQDSVLRKNGFPSMSLAASAEFSLGVIN